MRRWDTGKGSDLSVVVTTADRVSVWPVKGLVVVASHVGACLFFCVCGLEVGGDPVGVGGGELGEGLFPVGGELALDETGWGGAFAGGFALVLVAFAGAFVAVAGLLATVVRPRPRRRGSDRGSWSPLRSW